MAAPETMFVLEGRPTAQLIADQLRELIVQGAFSPGQQVNESALASQLSTSRGPLREALQRLCQEGILVSKRNRGVFVAELSEDDIREIYAVREAVELAAATTLLDSGQDKISDTCRVLKGIIKNMAKQVAASDWQALARLDMEFHTAFVSGTGNTRLIRIYQTLAAETRMCILSLEVAYPRIDALVQEHQLILDHLEAADRQGLQKAIKRHMKKAVEDLTSTPEVTEITA
ncbi:GntR family transcriptional regulator [Paenarthrobacter ureafaciens]|uniref:GntR family transcriptional regulator n=2 Tax=Paenarthrobacter TaxID=1742992 RepID=A0A558H6G5_PAENT|nr:MULTISPECIES: GntR family transcriptional regulator [Paenarthrobacter]NWL26220.1 GntR family transcriptional regulator [Paenarthrobacter ureafaciens]QSZ52013.1 GntR family transcriptional regulator [Paenarthrobacter ureafaciens]TVU64717.1 GntR family transcriptional regulator [Paenarthrobacter nitroguajacolicus]WOC61260.1 GntR family transcriptional regulator [Paenarthrobacter sp. AT5]